LSTQSATSTSSSPARADLDLGVLTAAIPADLVDEVIDEAGCREKRRRRLPARTVVYFVLGMCLFNAADGFCPPGYRAVLKVLTGRWRGVIKGRPVSSSALTQARARLGVKPLQLLFDRVRGPAADTPQPWSHAFGRRVVAWDATTIAVPDTPDNAAAFGYPGISSKRPPKPGHGRGKNNGTNPNVRLMTLIECGTHALIDGVFDGVAKASEIALAPRLIRSLRPGMLLLADRNFPGYELWGQARSSGADLLWRAKSSHRFIPIQYLPDGSYLSLMPSRKERYRLANRRRTGRNDPPREGHPVRVIEFTVTTTTPRGSRTEKYRLVTTLLDPAIAPAVELAALYRQRWEAETTYSNVKPRLIGTDLTLRSRTSQGIQQELYALLTVYQILTTVRVDAATQARLDPDRISFLITLRAVRADITSHTPRSPSRRRRAVITEIIGDPLGPRRPRTSPRQRVPRSGKYDFKRRDEPQPCLPTTYKIDIQPPN
jgi:Insertion element 4 transposase N-terminal/Transposase DDE domain